MMFFSRIFHPFVRFLGFSTESVLRLLGVKVSQEQPVTEEEIQLLIDQGTQAGVFEESEQDMVEGVFSLADQRVYSLMTPRPDIVWLDIEDSVEEIRQKIAECNYSRFPVRQGSLDSIIGIVKARDLLVRSLNSEPIQLKELLKPAFFVPETMLASRALEILKEKGTDILLVIDEFGALQGLLIQQFQLAPFIVTLAGMFLARGCCYLISTESIPINDATYAAIAQARIPVGFDSSLTVGALIALAVVLAGMRVAHATEFGRTVYAIGGGESSARLMGLSVASTKVGVYLLSGFCAALGGVVMTFYMLSGYSLHAVGLELDAIAAVVIGGTLLSGGVGYVAGTLFGVLILGIIQTLIAFDGTLSSWWTKIVVGVLLLLFCLLQRLFEARTRKAA